MILLQLIPQLEAGGAERTTLEVAQAVVAAGGRALVVSEGGRMEAELAALGGELVRLPVASKNPWTVWRNAGRIARIVRSEGVDIIHARSRAPAWSGKWAAARTDAHFITTYHGTYNGKTGLKRWYNAVMARGERVIANSNFIADHIRTHHPFAADRIRVIPRGVDLDSFDPQAVAPDRVAGLAAAWGVEWPSSRLIALFPARLTGWKGQRETLIALGQLKAEGLTMPLTLLAGDAQGRDAYRGELESLIAQYGLEDDVRIVGHCTDMPAAFAMADIALTPSVEPEAFGRTAAEAGAMHRPVIAADHGGAREVVLPGETGWRVEPGNPAALAAAIREAVSMSAERRAAIGERAAHFIRTQFSTRALQAATLRVYDEVLNSQP
ncbi:glycosyltransferase family 4 protein [uncultured Maricaulis sp.]|mgnify:CR=1 FL=1|uniref:glycosyltransferase family 4 protein n=1 Tax=uncultured Maricaulis sp. TaxID=174710 RepID=UPI0030DCE50D|tara:strand:- start:17199 stop:18344 length:1146 start_codon:yes stop_codon:yes gene_type:complete